MEASKFSCLPLLQSSSNARIRQQRRLWTLLLPPPFLPSCICSPLSILHSSRSLLSSFSSCPPIIVPFPSIHPVLRLSNNSSLKSALFACHFTCCKSIKKLIWSRTRLNHTGPRDFFFGRRPNTGRLRPDRILLFPFHSRLASLLLLLLMQTSCPPAYLLTLFLGKLNRVFSEKREYACVSYGMFSAMKSQIDI